MKAILLCCAFISLSGCVTFSPTPTVQDKYACHLAVAQSQQSGTLAGTGLYNECMRAHGYIQMCGAKACPGWSIGG